MEWLEPLRERKSYLFLMGYESLFTMFPQMWINETKRKTGEKLEDQSHNYYRSFRLTLFEKKFKYFFSYFFSSLKE